MWFCFNDAFVSAVQSDKPDVLMIRARRRSHLRSLFPGKPILTTENTDYKYRVFCTKVEWAEIVKERILDIDYTNFKNSVEDDALHHLYEKFWFQHYRYQK